MLVHTSRGILLEFRSVTKFLFLAIVLATYGRASAQAPETVVASVNGSQITLKQVDDSARTQIYPLQQQLYAIRKAALENLITANVLESEAKERGISIDELRKQLTRGEIDVTRMQVEEAYRQNATFFAAMSPDEAKSSARLRSWTVIPASGKARFIRMAKYRPAGPPPALTMRKGAVMVAGRIHAGGRRRDASAWWRNPART
jgi:hypothetical protein